MRCPGTFKLSSCPLIINHLEIPESCLPRLIWSLYPLVFHIRRKWRFKTLPLSLPPSPSQISHIRLKIRNSELWAPERLRDWVQNRQLPCASPHFSGCHRRLWQRGGSAAHQPGGRSLHFPPASHGQSGGVRLRHCHCGGAARCVPSRCHQGRSFSVSSFSSWPVSS